MNLKLTEKNLEDALLELNRIAGENPIGLRPTKILIQPYIIQELADRLNLSFDAALQHVKQICIGEIDVT